MAKKQAAPETVAAAPVVAVVHPPKVKIPKFVKKNKHRLPRKEKKAQKKAALTL